MRILSPLCVIESMRNSKEFYHILSHCHESSLGFSSDALKCFREMFSFLYLYISMPLFSAFNKGFHFHYILFYHGIVSLTISRSHDLDRIYTTSQ